MRVIIGYFLNVTYKSIFVRSMCVCKICTSTSYLLEKDIYKYHSPNYIVFMVLRNKILLLNNLRKVLRTYMSNMCVHKNLCALEYIS